jgi:nucleoside-diphosphate-sugar epimerase
MKILITGGAGFIGGHLAHYFHNNGHEVKVVDNLSTGSIDNIKDLTLHYADIRDNTIIQAMKHIDVVVNLAAISSVQASLDEPLETDRVNVIGLMNLLRCAGLSGVKMFIQASSAAVYGDTRYLN